MFFPRFLLPICGLVLAGCTTAPVPEAMNAIPQDDKAGTITPAPVAAHADRPQDKSGTTSPVYVAVKAIPLQSMLATTTPWMVTAYEEQEETRDEIPDVPSKICFSNASGSRFAFCELVTRQRDEHTCNYQYVRELKVVQITRTQRGVLFRAECNNGGSGSSFKNVIWVYDREHDHFDKAITFYLSEISDFEIFSDGPLAGSIVTADFAWFWSETEGHWSPHRFTIQVYWHYVASFGAEFYVQALQYLTLRKYDPEAEGFDVIGSELPRLRRILETAYPDGRGRP
jgi:hypothetical protein